MMADVPDGLSSWLVPCSNTVVFAIISVSKLVDLVDWRNVEDSDDSLTASSEYNLFMRVVWTSNREERTCMTS